MSFRDVIREKKGGGVGGGSDENPYRKQSNNTSNSSNRSSSKQQQQSSSSSSSYNKSSYNNNNNNNIGNNNNNIGGRGEQVDEEGFSEICSEIEKLLSEINKATLSIQKSTTTILGTMKDTHEHRESLSLIIKRSSQKVEILSTHISKLEFYEKFKKKVEKLKNQIEQVLKEYKKQTTNCLQVQKETLQQFQRNQEYLKQRNSPPSEYGNEKSYLLNQPQKEMYDEQLDNEIEFNTKILIEREKDILEVESSIREINGIFKELHFLTIQQGEGLDLIEDRIEETSHRIEQGKENIVRAEKHSKMGRNLICILLLIFLALGAALAIILVVLKVVGII